MTSDCELFVNFHRVSSRTRWIYVGNISKVEIKGIDTCKLELHGGRTLVIYDVLYAPEIRWNLVLVDVLLGFRFSLNFKKHLVKLCYDGSFYSNGHLHNGFMVLDCDRQTFDYYVDHFALLNICFSINASVNVYTWHARLGHIRHNMMNQLMKLGL